MKMRPYQDDAVNAIIAELAKVNSTMIVLPTGCGKTVCFAETIRRYPVAGRWMVLAHREELIRQGADKIERVTGFPCEIEMANERADLHMWKRSKVVVATVQTLSRGRMKRFDWTEFVGIITDEAHHAVSDSYRKIYDHARAENPNIKHVGVTATPDRADEEALGQIFDSVAYVYELTDAINDGYLVPITARSVEVEGLDFSSMRTTAGDLNGADLSAVMEYEDNLHRVADPTMKLAKWRKVLIFAASVAHAERLAEILNRHRPNCAQWFSGETPREQRRQMLADFAERRFQFLVNVGVLTEGYDEPTIDMVVMARPTKSRSLYSQMVGRGTRPLAGLIDGVEDADERKANIASSIKPNVEILDFVGNTGRHKLISAADILGGNFPDEVVARAAEAMRQKAESGKKEASNVQEELRKAERDIHHEKEIERARRQNVVARSRYSVSQVDPFDIFGIEPPRQYAMQKSAPITDKQKEILEKNGIATANVDRAQASRLCQEIFERRSKNQCTFKQAKTLQKYGYDTNVSFEEASATIDAIAQNGWKRPNETPDRAWTTVQGVPV